MLTLFISYLWHANQEAVRGVAFLDRVGFAGRGRAHVLSGCYSSWICSFQWTPLQPLSSLKIPVTRSKITGDWQNPGAIPSQICNIVIFSKLHLWNVECQSNWQRHLIRAHHPKSISDSQCHYASFLSPSVLQGITDSTRSSTMINRTLSPWTSLGSSLRRKMWLLINLIG